VFVTDPAPMISAGLPKPLVDVLLRAHRVELAAAGPARRLAWRTTRDLLGGLLAAGYSPYVIGDCLGVTADSIRTRASRDGWLPVPVLTDVLGISDAAVRQWRGTGLLPGRRVLRDGSIGYAAAELVRAIAHH
jgi:hypothetical protein